MLVGIPKESLEGETRAAGSPDAARKLIKRGFRVSVEEGAGALAGFADKDFADVGCETVNTKAVFHSDIIFKYHAPTRKEISRMKGGAYLFCLFDPLERDKACQELAGAGINVFAMDRIPRTSRAQSMDVLSSQANIAGYRAVIEAASHLPHFFPLMMTSAGSAKPARVAILGAGVAGLQAIATARRLGAIVQAYDVRPEVKEQIESLGAKFIDIDIGESGAGEGGYAKELSKEAKERQLEQLNEKLRAFDVIITTANIPGKRAPVLVTEKTVKEMGRGSVIVDMAARSGGNCALTEAGKVVSKHGVSIVGYTDYAVMLPRDASNFYGHNLVNVLSLMITEDEHSREVSGLNIDLNDDIIDGILAVYQGEIRGK